MIPAAVPAAAAQTRTARAEISSMPQKWPKKMLLKEKIKERLQRKIGKHLDTMADIAVEMLMGAWEAKEESRMKMETMTEKISKAMRGA